MPWTTSDVSRHNSKVKTMAQKKRWVAVANRVLSDTGDEGRAVKTANGVLKKDVSERLISFADAFETFIKLPDDWQLEVEPPHIIIRHGSDPNYIEYTPTQNGSGPLLVKDSGGGVVDEYQVASARDVGEKIMGYEKEKGLGRISIRGRIRPGMKEYTGMGWASLETGKSFGSLSDSLQELVDSCRD